MQKRFFHGIDEKDALCWNAIMAGNGVNGHGAECGCN